MKLTKKITVYVPDDLDYWVKNDMPRSVNLSEEVRNFIYSLRTCIWYFKYSINQLQEIFHSQII